ncbi:MAG: DUF3047 domain-containing protein [bacterium]|nr:DUF3047 domain-containing protein [bacterium]
MLLSVFLISASPVDGPRWLDQFKPADEGKFPSNWKKIQGRADIYTVQVESGNAFLAARPDKAAGMILTEAKVNPKDFPKLKWRWRAKKLPVGADETGKNGKNDCAASVYVVFDKGLTKYTKDTLRYVWSAYPHPRKMTLKMKDYVFYVIQENRDTPLDQWVEEEVDFAEDYRKLFKKAPPPVMAIGIQSDSDDTKTSSWADYDDFVLLPPGESLPKP